MHFIKLRILLLLLCSHKHAIRPFPGHCDPVHIYYNSVMINVILVSHLYQGHISGRFPSGFMTKILYALLFCVHFLFLNNIVSLTTPYLNCPIFLILYTVTCLHKLCFVKCFSEFPFMCFIIRNYINYTRPTVVSNSN